MALLSMAGGDRHVAVNAESHAPVGHGVVPGRTHEGVCVADRPAHDGIHGGDHTASRKPGDRLAELPHRSPCARVSPGLADVLDPLDVLRGVVEAKGSVADHLGLDIEHHVTEVKDIEQVAGASQNRGRAWMRHGIGIRIRIPVAN